MLDVKCVALNLKRWTSTIKALGLRQSMIKSSSSSLSDGDPSPAASGKLIGP